MIQQLRSDLSWFVALLCGLLLSLFIGWKLLASQDYAFSFWYDWYDISEHIDHYGPQNRYKSGLEALDRAEHERLFAEIVAAIHAQGSGLRQIQYEYHQQNIALLREPEAVHLEDVAKLIGIVNGLAGYLLVLLLLSVAAIRWQQAQLKWGRQAGLLVGLMALSCSLIFIIGPRAVFYQLHVWIFPAENEWFFYYQDSLMTTLMHAPQLFGGIAVMILLLGILIFLLAGWCGRSLKSLAGNQTSMSRLSQGD